MHSTFILAGSLAVLSQLVFAQVQLPLPVQSSIESLIGAKDVGPFRQLSPPKDEQEDGLGNDQRQSRRNRSSTSTSADQDTSAITTPAALPPADTSPASNSTTPSSPPTTSFQAGDFECIDSTKFKLFTSSTGSFVVNSCPPGFCFTRSPPKKNPCIGKDRALVIDAHAAA